MQGCAAAGVAGTLPGLLGAPLAVVIGGALLLGAASAAGLWALCRSDGPLP